MRDLITLIAALMWVAGVVLAKGFWMTAFTVCIPFYAWYLVVERAMQAIMWV